MFKVKNNLNQPITISDDRTLGAYDEFTVRSVDDNLRRLAEKGQITIVEPAAPAPPVEPEKGKGDNKNGRN